jgi:hypothetical protein
MTTLARRACRVTESALSDEADALYQPLGAVGPWAAAVDAGISGSLTVPLPQPSTSDQAWADVVDRGALLCAAHQSGALDGMHDGERGVAMSLLRGALPTTLPDGARAHVRANYEALGLAAVAPDADLAAEGWIRRVHEVACRPQLTHPVRGETGVHDHVLATGDFKHHPNHGRTAAGNWVAHAPVGALRQEMGRLLDALGSPDFAALPVVARAAYALHGITHVAPFADGNGRVARVLAGAHLLRGAAVPLLVFADEAADYDVVLAEAAAGHPAPLLHFVADRGRAAVELVGDVRAAGPSSPAETDALASRQERARAAHVLQDLLVGSVERALDRHRRRTDLGWLSRLNDAVVVPAPLVIRVPPTDVDEALVVDAHPLLDDGVVVLRAEQAGLDLKVSPGDLLPSASVALVSRLDGWLDRAVSTLALRVAAELE